MILLIITLFSWWSTTLNLNISNIKVAKGTLFVAVYNNQPDFLNVSKASLLQTFPVTQSGKQSFKLPPLAPGYYAICCFQDLNENKRLDTNIFGVPTEPYGFSRNVRPKFRAPTWNEACIEIKNSQIPLDIYIDSW